MYDGGASDIAETAVDEFRAVLSTSDSTAGGTQVWKQERSGISRMFRLHFPNAYQERGNIREAVRKQGLKNIEDKRDRVTRTVR